MRWGWLAWWSVIGSVAGGGYNLVDPNPACLTMGIQYCPRPSYNESVTNEYMSWYERTHQVLLNAMRMDPVSFAKTFTNNTITYACDTTGPRAPLRYSTNAQQAAKQQSYLLNITGCPFSHNTCAPYCVLYNNDCAWYTRVKKYEQNWTTMGENIAISRSDPLSPLKQFAQSAGHCANMLGVQYTKIGIGNIGRRWTQVFTATTPSGTIMNPFYDGTHWKGSPFVESDQLYFMTNYYDATPPSILTVIILGKNTTTNRTMTLQSGTRQRGTYVTNYTGAPAECLKYFFQARVNNTLYRLPEKGFFQTIGTANCSLNYSPAI